MNAKLTATIERDEIDGDACLCVRVHTDGLDRNHVYGWTMGESKMALAKRLSRAVNAGAALTVNGVLTDVNGKTYLSTTAHVMGRYMNADLRRLGF